MREFYFQPEDKFELLQIQKELELEIDINSPDELLPELEESGFSLPSWLLDER